MSSHKGEKIGAAQESLRDIEFDDGDDNACGRCGGEGWIMASDGDGSDWGEDTYCGPLDAEIKCRECNGTGCRRSALAGDPQRAA